jgi:hypothetical protein
MWKYQTEEREKVKRLGKNKTWSLPHLTKNLMVLLLGTEWYFQKSSFDITILIGDNLFFFFLNAWYKNYTYM